MTSIEQAREALIAQAAHVELGLNTPLDTKGATKELLAKLKEFLEALAAPPAAESEALPIAASTIDCAGTEHMSRDVAGIERIAREGSKGPTHVEYFYARPGAVVTEAARPLLDYLEAMEREPPVRLGDLDDRWVAYGNLVGGFTFGDLRRLRAALHPQSDRE